MIPFLDRHNQQVVPGDWVIVPAGLQISLYQVKTISKSGNLVMRKSIRPTTIFDATTQNTKKDSNGRLVYKLVEYTPKKGHRIGLWTKQCEVIKYPKELVELLEVEKSV